MPCQTPYRGDTSQLLLFKIASCCFDGGGAVGAGVTSFNGRTGVVTLTPGDVTTALGFTPISQADGDARYVLKSGDTMTGALAMPAGSAALPSNTFSGDLNTGMYSPGADSVGFSTGGTLRLTIASAAITSTVPIDLPDGTAAAPSLTFTSDMDTGLYRIGANSLGFSAAGVLALTLNSTSLISVGTVLLPNGTAALPALSFASDTNTGMYRIAADTIGLSVGGVLRFTLDGAGILAPGFIRITSQVQFGDGVTTKISSPSDGLFLLTDSALTSFNRIQLGGTTSAFPSIKRSGATIQFRLADDSGFAAIATAGIVMSVGAALSITSGANQRAGNAVLVAGTVTVANTSVTANTIVLLTRKTAGGTLGTAITYTTIAATSFTINSDSAIDTSTFSYLLIEVP